MDSEAYWSSRAAAVAEEYEQTIQAQRNELQHLQNQVSDLLHERSLAKAATASDVRAFCLNYQASVAKGDISPFYNAAQSMESALVSSGCTRFDYSARPSFRDPNATGRSDVIPIYDLLMFLHRYSNGLVPPPENRKKRLRSYSGGGSGNPRLMQRMLARQSRAFGVPLDTSAEEEADEYA